MCGHKIPIIIKINCDFATRMSLIDYHRALQEWRITHLFFWVNISPPLLQHAQNICMVVIANLSSLTWLRYRRCLLARKLSHSDGRTRSLFIKTLSMTLIILIFLYSFHSIILASSFQNVVTCDVVILFTQKKKTKKKVMTWDILIINYSSIIEEYV